jgi:hypothetical protein
MLSQGPKLSNRIWISLKQEIQMTAEHLAKHSLTGKLILASWLGLCGGQAVCMLQDKS